MFLLDALIAQGDFTSTFGTIEAPEGVKNFNTASPSGIGLILFISNIIKLATIVAGIWVFFNLISAGFDYVTSAGDSGMHNKVREKITMSIIGLILIVGAYTITAIISFVLFGKPGFILNPDIPQAPGGASGTP